MRLLVVEMGDIRLGLPVERIIEVIRAVAVTPLPSAPDLVDGLVDVRGAAHPVFDLRTRFGLEATPIRASQHFVLATTSRRMVALRVDRATEMIEIDQSAMSDVKHAVRGAERLAGVASHESGLILVHDLEALLTSAEEQALTEALASAGRSA